MIKIKSARHIGTDAWGRESRTIRTIYQIEQSDVGTKRENKGGHRQPAHLFTHNDIGRRIEVITDGSDYTCWFFLQPTTHGTAHFISRAAVVRYYGEEAAIVKLGAGEVFIGAPAIGINDKLSIIKDEGRYQITSYKGCI